MGQQLGTLWWWQEVTRSDEVQRSVIVLDSNNDVARVE
jgi:hypothetical protein